MHAAREPLEAGEWTEYYLNPALASACASTPRSVSDGHSVLLLASLASAEECTTLVADVMVVAQRELDERAELEECGLLDETMADDAGRVRLRVVERLGPPAHALCNTLLRRALGRLASLDEVTRWAAPLDLGELG